jgi:hypothetical protein
MDVDWSQLVACRGHASAVEVPKALELLFSFSPEERRRAYWQIDNYVVVQGGLYESAPYAARILVERIKAHPESLNTEVLDLLFELANGSAAGALVEHGPLKGQLVEQLCSDTVAEVLPTIAAWQTTATERERITINDLLDLYADRRS